MRAFSFVAAALLLAGCAKIAVVKVTAPAANPSPGVFYALPRTVVRVGVKVDRTVYAAAPYMKFASIFAPGSSPVCEHQDCLEEKTKAYALQKAVTFSTYGEPDPKNVYMVQFAGRGALDQTMAFTWSDTGLISTASASVTNRTGDLVVSGLKLATGIAAKSAFGGGVSMDQARPLACPNQPSDNDNWILNILASGADADAKMVVTGNYCEIPRENREKPTYRESVENKKLLAGAYNAYIRHIAPLTKARDFLLSGNSQTLEPTALITKIETLLDLQYKALYAGSKETKTWEGSIDLRNLQIGSSTLLRIDSKRGICFGSDVMTSADSKLQPDLFTILKSDDPACEAASPVFIQASLFPEMQLYSYVADAGDVSADDAKAKELGFRYRIPAQVKAQVVDSQSVLYGAGVFSVAQLGRVAALPARRHSKSLSYDLAMVEATGGLKSFKLSSTGSLDAGTADALSGISGTLLDARNASNTADKAARDEVNALTRQDTILKLKADICVQQKALGMECTVQ
jgi:hypothetical protein